MKTSPVEATRIACPFCDAPIGEPCRARSDRPTKYTHAARIDAARAATLQPADRAPDYNYPIGTAVYVDENAGLGRAQWYGIVTYNDPSSPYISVNNHSLRKYEVTPIPTPAEAFTAIDLPAAVQRARTAGQERVEHARREPSHETAAERADRVARIDADESSAGRVAARIACETRIGQFYYAQFDRQYRTPNPETAAATVDAQAKLDALTVLIEDAIVALARESMAADAVHIAATYAYQTETAEYDEDAIGMPAVSYADRASFDFDPAAEDAAIARATAPTVESIQAENTAAIESARQIDESIHARTRQILDSRRAALDSEKERTADASKEAYTAWRDADREEDRIKHDYGNPNNIRDWTAAQRRSAVARDRMSAAAAAAAHADNIARYAGLKDSTLAEELARNIGWLEMTGIAPAMIEVATRAKEDITAEIKARVAAHAQAVAEQEARSEYYGEDATADRIFDAGNDAYNAAVDLPMAEREAARAAAEREAEDSSVPAPVSAPYMETRRNAQRVANGARNQRDHYSHGNTPEDILIAVRKADRQLAIISPPSEWKRPTESIARWDHRGFILLIWSRYAPGIRLNNTEKHAYRLIDNESGPDPIFEGTTYGPSPMHAWNAPESFGALIAFRTLAPGDTDPEYFDAYTPAQLAWCQSPRAMELSSYAEELEGTNDRS